jgi:hypothetical protein
MSTVRSDENGLFIQAGGYFGRRGGVAGYDHALKMGDGGLKAGDKVKAVHVSQSPLIRITLENGQKLHWHTDDEKYLAMQAKSDARATKARKP